MNTATITIVFSRSIGKIKSSLLRSANYTRRNVSFVTLITTLIPAIRGKENFYIFNNKYFVNLFNLTVSSISLKTCNYEQKYTHLSVNVHTTLFEYENKSQTESVTQSYLALISPNCGKVANGGGKCAIFPIFIPFFYL